MTRIGSRVFVFLFATALFMGGVLWLRGVKERSIGDIFDVPGLGSK